jgi:hypothetical protein
MGTITTTDGAEIFYKDWGTGQPVVFSHGWPLTADVWDDQLFLVACNGYRAIAHDRRGGGGRSGQPWNGNDLDTYADDLAALIETLDLHDPWWAPTTAPACSRFRSGRRRLQNVPRFVITTGGEYLFMPAIRALKWLADLPEYQR